MVKKNIAEQDGTIEETAASDTLQPNGGTNGGMKMQAINMAIAAIAGMTPEDLSHFYNDTLSKFGHYADGVPDDGTKNAATIAAKPSAAVGGNTKVPAMPMPSLAKEDLESLFGSELTEENKLKATTLFEAAVSAAVTIEKVRLEEETQKNLVEQVNTIKEEFSDNVDKYLTYSIKEWVKNNEVAIQESLKNERMENFIVGLKKLFAEHYVELPEDQVDLVAEMQNQINSLTDKLNETIKEKMSVEEQVILYKKNEVFEEVSSGMTLTQVEKLRELSETFKNEDIETFKKKLNVLKESTIISSKTPVASNILTENFEPDNVKNEVLDPSIQRYVDAVSRTVKK